MAILCSSFFPAFSVRLIYIILNKKASKSAIRSGKYFFNIFYPEWLLKYLY